ncbi:hypothetical protein HPULCUR_004204 [Helicostylum pulchrum]|uniref:Uncharacterized protein n=1 Tax=Helicostylum pulchrum TaxID=562976 RepID=A0ABP9XWL0_9FUNG
MNTYKDEIEAYVFDTKFDIILGRSWLAQVQPIPDWFTGEWKIPVKRGSNKFSLIRPVTSNQIDDLPKRVQNVAKIQKDVEVHNLDFLITAKQLDNLMKKKKTEECYFVDIKQIIEHTNLNNIDQITTNKLTVSITENKKINQQWCNEFKTKYPNVFKNDIDMIFKE